MTLFDLVMFLALFGMFIVGYMQGITRRLLGIGAILFSLVLAAQLRSAFGGYLASEWSTLPADYGYMVGFLAVFVGAAVALSFGIQISYKPAPLLWRYPVLDEILGGCLGVIEGLLIFMAIMIILDPYYRASHGGVVDEFGPLRSLWQFIDPSLTAALFRENVIPGLFVVFGFIFPESVVAAFRAH
jgi:uncharacterized membrane protein required for colicin V production